MKNVIKISLTLLMIVCMTMLIFQNSVYATSKYSSEMQNLINADYEDSTNSVNKVNSVIATILTSIRIVGITVAIVMLLVLAMKYMTAAPGDKADIKKGLITYVIGATVFFGVIGILEIISQFATAIE